MSGEVDRSWVQQRAGFLSDIHRARVTGELEDAFVFFDATSRSTTIGGRAGQVVAEGFANSPLRLRLGHTHGIGS